MSSEVIEASLQDVLAGRWSELRRGSNNHFRCAHNADALESLCENLSSLEHPPYVLQALVRQIGQSACRLDAKATEVVVVQPTHDEDSTLRSSELNPKHQSRSCSLLIQYALWVHRMRRWL